MTPRYICLSMHADSVAGGAFTRDPKARWTTIRKGVLVAGKPVVDPDYAANVFALRIARRAYGKRARAQAWKSGSVACGENHTIYECTMDDGSHYAEFRLAIVDKAD